MRTRFKNLLLRLHRDESGAMSVEKILILALIALPIIIVLFLFKARILTWFGSQQSQLADPGTGSIPGG